MIQYSIDHHYDLTPNAEWLTIIMLDIKAFSKWRLMLKVSYFLGFMETMFLSASVYTRNVLSRLSVY